MFNVCPQCGDYQEDKLVLQNPSRAVCRSCKHEHSFLSLPLYVVTGASGTGKTTAALALSTLQSNIVVLDQDILWCEAFNNKENDYRQFRDVWLRMVKNIHQAGKSVVLFGSSVPEQFENSPERRYLQRINYLALVCSPNEITRRLKERPAWRASASEENLHQMRKFNQWLIDNAANTKPAMEVLDTSEISVGKTVEKIREWIAANPAEKNSY